MPYPAETVDGEVVSIVEKGQRGDREIFRASDGSIYQRSATEELKLELVELGEAVEGAAEAVQAEVEESVTEIVAEAREQLEEVKNASVLDAPAEMAEAIDAVVEEVKEGIEEVGDAVKAGVESVLAEAGDVADEAGDYVEGLLGREDDDAEMPAEEPSNAEDDEATQA